MLPEDVAAEIIEKANELYFRCKPWFCDDYFFLNYNSNDTISRLLKFNNIELHKRNFKLESFCGLLIIDELGSTIAINQNHIPSRQLFTTAHELGHFYLHREFQSEFFEQGLKENVYSPLQLEKEKQANLFASELAVPLEVLEYMLHRRLSFYKIAKIIGVSKEALKWRIHRYLREKYFLNYQFAIMLVEEYKDKSINHRTSESLIFDVTDDNHVLYEIYEALCGRESFIHLYREKQKVGIFI